MISLTVYIVYIKFFAKTAAIIQQTAVTQPLSQMPQMLESLNITDNPMIQKKIDIKRPLSQKHEFTVQKVRV